MQSCIVILRRSAATWLHRVSFCLYLSVCLSTSASQAENGYDLLLLIAARAEPLCLSDCSTILPSLVTTMYEEHLDRNIFGTNIHLDSRTDDMFAVTGQRSRSPIKLTNQRKHWPIKHTFSHNSRIHMLIMTTLSTNCANCTDLLYC